jgi:hypothetical protein
MLSITDSVRYADVSSSGVRAMTRSSEFWIGRSTVEAAASTMTQA